MDQQQHIGIAHIGRAWLQGSLAGFLATVPMTLFMLGTQRFLPKRQRYALPPEIITEEVAHRTQMRWHMSKKQIEGATLVSHFAYGAAMGAVYGPLGKKLALPSPAKGVLFGLVVWAGSYLGLLPLLGVPVSGQREPVRRNLMMIAAHVIWGSTLGVVTEVL